MGLKGVADDRKTPRPHPGPDHRPLCSLGQWSGHGGGGESVGHDREGVAVKYTP